MAWTAESDRSFHDGLFAEPKYDPFSPAYPGNLTITRFADLAAEHMPPSGDVIDLGCGPGEITCELARRFPRVTFAGVDHSREAIARANGHAARLGLENVSFSCGDVAGYVPTRAPVGLITMFDSFHHVLDPEGLIARLRALTTKFFLIEPVGDALGRWRESHDFDWVMADLDGLREKLDEQFGVAPFPPPSPGGDRLTTVVDGAVERRYTLDDFERLFDGYSLTVVGTAAGLTTYPPAPPYETEWRRAIGRQAIETYRTIDERLRERDWDLRCRHWAIAAVPGPRATRREPAAVRPLKLSQSRRATAYSVKYEGFDGPRRVPAGARVDGTVRLTNVSTEDWSGGGDHPFTLAYRWLLAGVEVTDPSSQARSALPASVPPGATIDVPLVVRTPQQPGSYVLSIDLVHEGVTWFGERGNPPLRVHVRVTAS